MSCGAAAGPQADPHRQRGPARPRPPSPAGCGRARGWRWSRPSRSPPQNPPGPACRPGSPRRCRPAQEAGVGQARGITGKSCVPKPISLVFQMQTAGSQAIGARVFRLQPRPLTGLAEADDGHHVLGAGTQVALLPAPGHQRGELDPLVHHQRAGAQRARSCADDRRQSCTPEGVEI